MNRRSATILTSLGLMGVLAVGGALPAVPYVALTPGPTYNTLGRDPGNLSQPIISVTGATTYRNDSANGHLNMVTVSVVGGPGRELGLFRVLGEWLDPNSAVVLEEDIYPKGTTEQQSQHEGQVQMEDSQQSAVSAALNEIGMSPSAVTVVGFADSHPPSEKVLRKGDEIQAVNGVPFKSTSVMHDQIATLKPGDTVTVTVKRGASVLNLTVPTIASPDNPKRAVVGVYLKPTWPVQVDFHLERVGGPSAGLMFSLGLIDLLTPGSLTQGRFIAGTGEIESDGTVDPIGGIAQKMVGARRAGARYFLAPADNCPAVRRAHVPHGLQVVKVATLHEALGDVEAIAGGRSAGLPGC